MIPVSDVLTLIFVWVDDLVKQFRPSRLDPAPEMSDSEVTTFV